jgi:hypothetical protein
MVQIFLYHQTFFLGNLFHIVSQKDAPALTHAVGFYDEGYGELALFLGREGGLLLGEVCIGGFVGEAGGVVGGGLGAFIPGTEQPPRIILNQGALLLLILYILSEFA